MKWEKGIVLTSLTHSFTFSVSIKIFLLTASFEIEKIGGFLLTFWTLMCEMEWLYIPYMRVLYINFNKINLFVKKFFVPILSFSPDIPSGRAMDGFLS